jgi:hypothetical protein
MTLTANIFRFVEKSLRQLSGRLNLTYETVNVLTYYIALPLVYAVLGDAIMQFHVFKLVWVCTTLLILLPVNRLRKKSEIIFRGSVIFLESFGSVGLDYVQASVLICVIVPIVVLLVLCALI